MKFRMRVRRVGDAGQGWWEDYDKPGSDAAAVARKIIRAFNESLRPHESARELMEVIVSDPTPSSSAHTFEKMNAFTITGHGDPHDIYCCKVCGVTAKRYALNEGLKIDPRYRAKFYRDCAATVARKAR